MARTPNASIEVNDPEVLEIHLSYEERRRRQDIEAGYLGKLFGTGSHVASSIAGLVVLLSLLGAFVLPAIDHQRFPFREVWSACGPLMTAALGYLFGVGVGSNRASP